MGRFRIGKNDDLKLSLYTADGKLLITIIDSGFRNLNQCRKALIDKAINPPRDTRYKVYNITKDEQWSNL